MRHDIIRIIFTFFVIAIFFFIPGCLKNITGASQYADEYVQNLRYINASGTPGMLDEGSCTCMICRNSTFLFGVFTSFVGGDCKFITPCDQNTFEMYSNPQQTKNYTLRQFMIGAGPSFADFGAANSYCYNKLSMAVHWLVGAENRPYSLPSAERAMCMLDKGVIPVYVLYSDGKNIDPDSTREIAAILGHEAMDVTMGRVCGAVGPTIVTTEIDFNSTDPAVIDRVVEQIHAINEGCNDFSKTPPEINCFVAVAPKMGDTKGLDAVMGRVSREEVHLLAFGINSHYDNGTCNGAFMHTEAVKFARYGLYKYGLPSVIPYVLFDANTMDATGRCTWSEENVLEGYRLFFPSGVVSLLGAGVIGVAPYDFNSSATGGDPLRCNDCALGASEERLAAWYGGCQKMVEIGNKVPSAQMPIIFPNASGAYCDYGVQQDALFHIYRDAQGTEFYLPISHTLAPPEKELFRCDACLLQSNKTISDYYPTIKKYVVKSLPDYSDKCPDCPDPAICYIYPEIDYYSSRFNVDPTLMRAIAWVESDFNKCSAALVGSGEGCLRGAYDTGYNFMYDPSGECDSDLENLMGKSGYYEPGVQEGTRQPKCRFAGLGLFQVIEPPYTFWPSPYYPEEGKSGPYADEYERAKDKGRAANIDGARACSPYFNPFNTTDAACMGARKLEGAIKFGMDWVDKTSEDCSSVPDLFEIKNDPAKRDILATFAATYLLAGVWRKGYDEGCPSYQTPLDCWASKYCALKTCKSRQPPDCGLVCTESGGKCVPTDADTSACAGSRDFLDFSECLVKQHGMDQKLSMLAGFRKLGAYESLQTVCPSFCPPQKRLLDEKLKVNSDFTESQIAEDPYIVHGTPWSVCRP